MKREILNAIRIEIKDIDLQIKCADSCEDVKRSIYLKGQRKGLGRALEVIKDYESEEL